MIAATPIQSNLEKRFFRWFYRGAPKVLKLADNVPTVRPPKGPKGEPWNNNVYVPPASSANPPPIWQAPPRPKGRAGHNPAPKARVVQPSGKYYSELNSVLDAKDFQKARVYLMSAHKFSPEAYKYVLGIAIRKGDDDFLKLALSKQARTADDDLMLMSYARNTHPGQRGRRFLHCSQRI